MEGPLLYIVIYLLLGCATGVLAGLFGVGGGTIIVPALILSFTALQFSADILTHMAIGTSLAIISFTAVSSTLAHNEHGAILWGAFGRFVPGICLGVLLGSEIASQLSGSVLQRCFGVFLWLIALQMWFEWHPSSQNPDTSVPGWMGLSLAGLVIGVLSALFGIGGGSLTVPFLTFFRVPMQKAVATAAAVGLPIAVSGALAYGWQGWGNPSLPEMASGFIYWPALVGVAIASVFFAKLGARLAHQLDADKLKKMFAVFLVLIGGYFLLG